VIIEAIDNASGTFTAVGTEAAAMGEGVAAAGAAMLTAGLAFDAVALGLGKVAEAGAEFQTRMVEIQNNTTMTNSDVDAMRQGILALGADTGAPLDQLGTGFMKAMNITNDTSAAMDILKIATESAVSTGGNAASTTNVLANAMHEYGADVSTAATAQERHTEILGNATRYMGVFHLAAAEGNMTLEQFSNASGKSIGIAANLGVGVEDVSAAFATLTKHGFDANQAGTQVTAMLTHMINPTKASHKELLRLSQLTGIDLVSDFSAAGLHTKGLSGVVGDLGEAFKRAGITGSDQKTIMAGLDGTLEATTKKYMDLGMGQAEAEQEAMKLINAQRGGLGMAVLLGTGAEDYKKILGDLTNQEKVNTVTEESFARMHETAGNQMARLKVGVQETAIALGTAMLPAVTAILGPIADGASRLASWAQAHAATIGPILAVVAAVSGIIGVLLTLGGALLLASTALAPLAGLFSALLGPLGLVVAAVALLAVAWAKDWGGIREITASVVAAVQGWISGTLLPILQNFGSLARTALQLVVEAFRLLTGGEVAGGLEGFVGRVRAFVSNLVGTITDLAGRAASGFLNVARAFVEWVTPLIPQVLAALGNFFSMVGTAVHNALPAIEAQLASWGRAFGTWVTETAIPFVQQNLPLWLSAIGTFLSSAVTAIAGFIGPIASAFGTWVQEKAIPFVQQHLPEWLSAIGTFITGTAIPAVTGFVGGLASAMGTWVSEKAVPFVQQHLPEWLNSIGTFITGTAIPAVTGFVGPLAEKLGTWVSEKAIPFVRTHLTEWLAAIGSFISGTAIPAVTAATQALGNALGEWITTKAIPFLTQTLPQWLSTIGTFISGTAIPAVKAATTALGEALGNWITTQAIPFLQAHLPLWVTALATGLTPALTAIATFVTGALDRLHTLVSVGGEAFSAFGSAVRTAMSAVGIAFSAFGTAVQGAIAAVTPLVSAIGTGLHGALTALGTILGTVGSAFQSTNGAASAIRVAFDALGTAARTIVTVLQEVGTALGRIITQAAADYFTILKAAVQPLIPILTDVGKVLGSVLVAAIGLLVGAVGGLAGALTNVLAGGLRILTGLLEVAAGGIKIFSSVVTGMVQVVTDLIHGNWTAAWHDAQTALSGAFDGMKLQVLGLSDILLGSFQTMFGSILGAIGGFGATVVTYFADMYQKTTGQTLPWAADMIKKFQDMSTGAITSTQGMHDKIAQLLDLSPVAAGVEQTTSRMGSSVAGMNGPFLTATSGVNALGVAVSGYQEHGAGFNNTISGLGSAVLSMASSMDTGTKAAQTFDKNLQEIGSAGSVLKGYLGTLQSQWDDLNKITNNGTTATAAQKQQYIDLAPRIEYLNGAIGANKDQTVTATNAAVDHAAAVQGIVLPTNNAATATTAHSQAATAASTSIATFGSALGVGATAAGTLATAANGATTAANAVSSATATAGAAATTSAGNFFNLTGSIQDVPKSSTTTVASPGAVVAAGQIAGVSLAIALVSKSFTVTAKVDISGALASIADLNAHLPHSPAEKGPFSTLPNWDALLTTLAPALDKGVETFVQFGSTVGKTADQTMTAFARGITNGTHHATTAAHHAGTQTHHALTTPLRNTHQVGQHAITQVGHGITAGTHHATTAAHHAGTQTQHALHAPLKGNHARGQHVVHQIGRGITAGTHHATTAAHHAGTRTQHALHAPLKGNHAHGTHVIHQIGRGITAGTHHATTAAHHAATQTRHALTTPLKGTHQHGQQVLTDIGQGITDGAPVAVTAASKAIGAVAGAIKTGLAAIADLSTIGAPGTDHLTSFMDAIRPIIQAFEDMAAEFGAEGMAAATKFAESAGKILGIVKTGVEALNSLATFIAPTKERIGEFKFATEFLVQSLGDSAAVMDTDFVANAVVWSESAGKVLGILKAGVDGLNALADFKRPTDEAIGDFKFATEFLVQSLGDSAQLMGNDFAASAAQWAEHAGKALGILKTGVEGLSELTTFKRPSDQAIGDFKFATEFLVQSLGDSAQVMDSDFAAGAAKWAESAGKALGILKTGVEGLTLLSTFKRPSDQAIGDFKFATEFLMQSLGDSAQVMGGAFSESAAKWAESAGKVLGILKTGVEGLSLLRTFRAPSIANIEAFKFATEALVQSLGDSAQAMGTSFAANAATWAEHAGKALGILKTGVAGLSLLRTFKAPSIQNIEDFKFATEALVHSLGDSAAAMDASFAANAAKWAEHAGKALDILKKGVEGLSLLRTFQAPSIADIDAFKFATEALLQSLGDSAAAMDATFVANATTWAESAGKALGILKTGVEGLTLLSSFTAPSKAAIDEFVDATAHVVDQMGAAAAALGGDGLAQAVAFSEAASKALAAAKTGADAFKAMSEVATPSKAAMDSLVEAIRYVVQRFADIAAEVNDKGMAKMTLFASAAGKALDAAKKGTDLFKDMADLAPPSLTAVDTLLQGIKYVVQRFTDMASEMEDKGLKRMEAFATAAGKALDSAKKGTDLFKAMAELAVPSRAAIDTLLDGIKYVVQRFSDMASEMEETGLKRMAAFAAAAGKSLDAAKKGAELFKAMADQAPPSKSAINDLLEGIKYVVQRFSDIANEMEDTGIKRMAAFATAAGKALDAAKKGTDLFKAMEKLSVPSKDAINNLLEGIKYVVKRFSDIATELEGEGVKRMEAFATAAGKALDATKKGVELFKAMEKLKAPAKDAIDSLLDGIVYVVKRLDEIANNIGVEGLNKAKNFARDLVQIYDDIKKAVDIFKGLESFRGNLTAAMAVIAQDTVTALEQARAAETDSRMIKDSAQYFLDNMHEAARKFAEAENVRNSMNTNPAAPPSAPSGGGSTISPEAQAAADRINLPFGGARAGGGPVAGGTAYIVGDGGGPELFIPNQGGYIIPRGTGRPTTVGADGGGGGGVTNVYLTINGTVTSERDLIDTVYQGLLRKRQGNTSLGLA